MTLSDCSQQSVGKVKAIGGDLGVHRRLVDMGMLDADYCVAFKRKRSALIDFCGSFSAVVRADTARIIEVVERRV